MGWVAEHAHERPLRRRIARLTFDAGGIGGEIKPHLRRLSESGRKYAISSELFGGKVAGPKRVYANKWTNEEYFALRNLQIAFGLRLRVQSTIRLRAGEDVEADHCLFINPEIPDIQVFLSQLAQPIWKEHESSAKIVIDKLGHWRPVSRHL